MGRRCVPSSRAEFSLNRLSYFSGPALSVASFFIQRLECFVPDIDLRGKTVLDIGCWWGWFLKYAKDRGANPYGFDCEATRIKDAVDLLRSNTGLCVASGEAVPFKSGSFEIVFSSHVLEHVNRDHVMIGEIHRTLKSGGSLIIAVPNDYGVATFIYRVFRWFLVHKSSFLKRHNRYDWLKSITYNDISHHREYTKKTLQDILRANNFRILKVRSFGVDIPYPIKGHLSKLVRLNISRLFGPITPSILREEIVVHAIKE